MEIYRTFYVYIDMLTACILLRFNEEEPAIQASQLELIHHSNFEAATQSISVPTRLLIRNTIPTTQKSQQVLMCPRLWQPVNMIYIKKLLYTTPWIVILNNDPKGDDADAYWDSRPCKEMHP